MARGGDAKSAQRALWASGNYFLTSHHANWMSEVLCEAISLRAGQAVVDLACGNGNTALAAARRGAVVTAVDLTPELIAAAASRAAAEHLDIDWQEGDVEQLPFGDATFDVALSTIGIMFAPEPDVAVGEVARILRSGGRFGAANWLAESAYWSDVDAVRANYGPSPAVNPWMSETGTRVLLDAAFVATEVSVQEVHYRFASAKVYVDAMLQRFGPWLKLAESLTPSQRGALRDDLVAAVEPHNVSGDDTLDLPIPYLQVTTTKR